MSVLARYTTREILLHAGGIFVVVLAVFLLGRFSKLLGDASEGALPLATILALLALRTLMALPSLGEGGWG
jgi:lipopolysaccharide export LptBFGC system permease protein LptF